MSLWANPYPEPDVATAADIPSRRRNPPFLPLLVWCVFVGIQGRIWFAVVPLVYIAPLVDVAVAAVAIGVSLRGLARTVSQRWVRTIVTVLMVIFAAYSLNWSIFSPASYFAVHRAGFDAIAARADAGHDGGGSYSGEWLPVWLVPLSGDGHVSVGGRQDDLPAVVVPEAYGLIDNAIGYVYLSVPPDDDLDVDLHGYFVRLSTADYLGGGWWWAG